MALGFGIFSVLMNLVFGDFFKALIYGFRVQFFWL